MYKRQVVGEGVTLDLLVVNGDVAADIHTLNVDNMDVIMKDGWIVDARCV